MRSDVNAALSSLYLELAGELAADVNGIVRNHIADLEAEIAKWSVSMDMCRKTLDTKTQECIALTAERDRLKEQRKYWILQTGEAREWVKKLESEVTQLRTERVALLSAIDPSIDGLAAEVDELEAERDELALRRDDAAMMERLRSLTAERDRLRDALICERKNSVHTNLVTVKRINAALGQ